jgi:hypothetical protein
MSLLAAIRKLWHSIAPRTHSDVEEEFRSTLDAYQEDLIRQGLPEEEARRKARIDLGQPAAQNETYRDAIGLRLFDELGGDGDRATVTRGDGDRREVHRHYLLVFLRYLPVPWFYASPGFTVKV